MMVISWMLSKQCHDISVYNQAIFRYVTMERSEECSRCIHTLLFIRHTVGSLRTGFNFVSELCGSLQCPSDEPVLSKAFMLVRHVMFHLSLDHAARTFVGVWVLGIAELRLYCYGK